MTIQKYSEIYERARQDDPEAIYTLGTICEREKNVKEGRKHAEIMYCHAARLGHPKALTALGNILNAEGKKNLAADMWFLAAEKGSTTAMIKISNLFRSEGMDDTAEEYEIRAITAEETKTASTKKNNNGGKHYE